MRPEVREELDLTKRPDRLGQYVRPHLDRFLFANYGEEYLAKTRLDPSFSQVPIPLRREDLSSFAGGGGLTPDQVAENMVWIMGCDPHFRYVPDYLHYLRTFFDESLSGAFLSESAKALEEEDTDSAFVHARAALLLAPEDRDAMFHYAMVTRAMYQDSEAMELTGRCKADSLEYLELCTLEHPSFAPPYYCLGYSYLNLGLYGKAQRTWEEYPTLADQETDSRQRQEIRERLATLKDPVAVEAGINEAMAGRFEQAILALEPYVKGSVAGWWPLHYYLAVSYEAMGRSVSDEREAAGYTMKALDSYRNVLRLNPAHLETLNQLADLYLSFGDEENYYKSHRKARIVAEGLEEESSS